MSRLHNNCSTQTQWTRVLYNDFMKAFDKVSHRKIYPIKHLRAYGFGEKLMDWVGSFLISRKQRVVEMALDGVCSIKSHDIWLMIHDWSYILHLQDYRYFWIRNLNKNLLKENFNFKYSQNLLTIIKYLKNFEFLIQNFEKRLFFFENFFFYRKRLNRRPPSFFIHVLHIYRSTCLKNGGLQFKLLIVIFNFIFSKKLFKSFVKIFSNKIRNSQKILKF